MWRRLPPRACFLFWRLMPHRLTGPWTPFPLVMADVYDRTETEDAGKGNLRSEKAAGQLELVGDGAAIDLDLHQVRVLLGDPSEKLGVGMSDQSQLLHVVYFSPDIFERCAPAVLGDGDRPCEVWVQLF